MKKIMLSVLVVGAMASCKKEVKETVKQKTDYSLETEEPNNKLGGTSLRVYSDMNCSGTGGTCLPDIIIWGERKILIDNFYDILETDGKINDFINSNYTKLSEEIESKYLNGVLNNELTLEVSHNAMSNTKFFIFKYNGDNVAVYPFVNK